jgi:uncharacterized protein YuzE
MNEPQLQVTYRRGRAEVAYLHLPRRPGDKVVESERVEPEMVLDFNEAGKLIGIEFVDPEGTTLAAVNEVLQKHGFAPLTREDLAPLMAA